MKSSNDIRGIQEIRTLTSTKRPKKSGNTSSNIYIDDLKLESLKKQKSILQKQKDIITVRLAENARAIQVIRNNMSASLERTRHSFLKEQERQKKKRDQKNKLGYPIKEFNTMDFEY